MAGGGLGPPLTERMASLMWVSRWSFLRMAPVSGQVKYTPGTSRWVEPSSLASGTWGDGDESVGGWTVDRGHPKPLSAIALKAWPWEPDMSGPNAVPSAMGHLGSVPEPIRGCFLVCEMSLQDQLRIQCSNFRHSVQSMAPAVPVPHIWWQRGFVWWGRESKVTMPWMSPGLDLHLNS